MSDYIVRLHIMSELFCIFQPLLAYSCAKTKGNTLVHKECTRFKLGVHY